MNILLVGGLIGHKSGVLSKLANIFRSILPSATVTELNEGIVTTSVSGYDLILWFPEIDNEEEKVYPKKDRGAVLICSKVMREDTTRLDAVSRIFRMHGNAVACITPGDKFTFELVDALANTWVDTSDLNELVGQIMNLYYWTKSAVRKSLAKLSTAFIDINRKLAKTVATNCGNRFFGNYSARCWDLFPSSREYDGLFLFSPRNTDKRGVTADDLVVTSATTYIGNKKPSVDAPVQLEIYQRIPKINYMIHGHAFIHDAPTTEHYFPCGDLREVPEAVYLLETGHSVINLRNHGFLITSTTLPELEEAIAGCTFYKDSLE
jgi:hypothetical protein